MHRRFARGEVQPADVDCVLWTCVTWHSKSLRWPCKEGITTNTDRGWNENRPSYSAHSDMRAHTHTRGHLLEEWQRDTTRVKTQREKQVGKTTWGEKHPPLSGVEHIPPSVVTLSWAISILVNSVVSCLLILQPNTSPQWVRHSVSVVV